ncbi:MAG: queuosine salvage family protein [Desulfobacterota bacterium]|nr:queuosine salvage family protein [Thermodesulfobacteriota bacterium]
MWAKKQKNIPAVELVKATTAEVCLHAEDVKINDAAINKFCETFNSDELCNWWSATPFDFSDLTVHEKINLLFVFNSISFCYWGEPKWTLTYQGKKYDGTWALLGALRRALDSDKLIITPTKLKDIDVNTVSYILRGEGQIPLLKERTSYWKELGEIVTRKFNGNFYNVVYGCASASELLDLVIYEFPLFYDSSKKMLPCGNSSPKNGVREIEVHFHKRAQLLVHDICSFLHQNKIFLLRGEEDLTGCADYKIPQVLRYMGILSFSQRLCDIVDRQVLIPHGSREELEIRACTIQALLIITDKLKMNNPTISAMSMNDYFWLMGQSMKKDACPYHRTLTTAY